MSYQSRSDFFFNIRELAESIHAKDLKAINEGLGLGTVVSNKSKIYQRVQNQINHNQVTQGHESWSQSGTVDLKEPQNHYRDLASTQTQTQREVFPNTQKRTYGENEKRSGSRPGNFFLSPLKFIRKLKGVATFSLGHLADLVVVITCLTVASAVIYKLLPQLSPEVNQEISRRLSWTENVRSLKAIAIICSTLYFFFLTYWLAFKIFGLRTIGNLLFNARVGKVITDRNNKENIPVSGITHKKF